MDANVVITSAVTLAAAVSFIVTTTVIANITRSDLKEFKREFADFKKDVADFKTDVDARFTAMDTSVNARITALDASFNARITTLSDSVNTRLGRLEVDIAEIKAICRERNYRETPA